MNFELTQQQKAIQETARKFAQEELLPGVLERDAKSEFPVEQFHKMGELGLIGLPYPKDVGRILRTFKIKKNVEVTDNGKDNF